MYDIPEAIPDDLDLYMSCIWDIMLHIYPIVPECAQCLDRSLVKEGPQILGLLNDFHSLSTATRGRF